MQAPEPWLTGNVRFPVYYEDSDFSGYVYHANYLKYFERAREELVGIPHVKSLYQRGIHYVVARMELSFHAPARHGDLVEVATRMRISPSPVGLVEQVARLGEGGTKLVSAKIKLVAVDATGEATRVPEDVLAFYRELVANNSNC
jgi:acyl-CoA thioester hydrolase